MLCSPPSSRLRERDTQGAITFRLESRRKPLVNAEAYGDMLHGADGGGEVDGRVDVDGRLTGLRTPCSETETGGHSDWTENSV